MIVPDPFQAKDTLVRRPNCRARKQIDLEVHFIFRDQVSHGKRILGRLSFTQVHCQRSLRRPAALRCTLRLSYTISPTPLTVVPANDGVSPNDRIVDTPS